MRMVFWTNPIVREVSKAAICAYIVAKTKFVEIAYSFDKAEPCVSAIQSRIIKISLLFDMLISMFRSDFKNCSLLIFLLTCQ